MHDTTPRNLTLQCDPFYFECDAVFDTAAPPWPCEDCQDGDLFDVVIEEEEA